MLRKTWEEHIRLAEMADEELVRILNGEKTRTTKVEATAVILHRACEADYRC